MNGRTCPFAWALVLALAVPLLAGAASPPVLDNRPSGVSSPTGASVLLERQRYGFVAHPYFWPDEYDVSQLHAGWFVDFTRNQCRIRPQGMDRALGIKLLDGHYSPPELGPLVDHHPDTLWLIGNEPDCIYQDNLVPADYARIYHDLYTFIKGRDPTARVAPGGIVQPSPIRLAYLDLVLDSYQKNYGVPMPVDVWAIHNAIINEKHGEAGADVPPGMDPADAQYIPYDEHDSLSRFTRQIRAFRQWMADRGYRGYPLIITEFGVLFPPEMGFTSERVNAFMSGTFQFLRTATDPVLGDPTDDYRLVQRWAWYSLSDKLKPDGYNGFYGFNGHLFDPDTKEISVYGQHFAELAAPYQYPEIPHIDLLAGRVLALAPRVLVSPTDTLTLTLRVELKNAGTVDAGPFRVIVAYNGRRNGSLQQVVDGVAAGSARWAFFTLTNLPAGRYTIWGQIDADGQVAESTECNNWIAAVAIAPRARAPLPIVWHRARGGRSEAAGAAGSPGLKAGE